MEIAGVINGDSRPVGIAGIPVEPPAGCPAKALVRALPVKIWAFPGVLSHQRACRPPDGSMSMPVPGISGTPGEPLPIVQVEASIRAFLMKDLRFPGVLSQ